MAQYIVAVNKPWMFNGKRYESTEIYGVFDSKHDAQEAAKSLNIRFKRPDSRVRRINPMPKSGRCTICSGIYLLDERGLLPRHNSNITPSIKCRGKYPIKEREAILVER